MPNTTIQKGEKFFKWTIVEEIETPPYSKKFVRVQCECGEIRVHDFAIIRRGAIKSCGCSKKKYPTIQVGDIFSRLTIIEVNEITINSQVKVRCVCGNELYVQINRLNVGKTRSCGCLHDEIRGNILRTHGLSHHKLNGVWREIKKRCYNPNCPKFRFYGGSVTGPVTMCEKWRNDFQAFYDWAIANGWKEGLQIDKDKKWKEKHGTFPGKEYSPEYCCFLTRKENCRNRTTSNIVEYNGDKKSLTEWGEIFGIKPSLLSDRLFGLNMTPEEAFNKPVRGSKEIPADRLKIAG